MAASVMISTTINAQTDKKQAPATPQPVVVAAPQSPMFKTKMDTISYILGADIAKSFIKNEMNVNQDKLFKGYADGMAKKDTVFTEAQIAVIMKAYQEEMTKVIQDKADAAAKKANETAKAFFAANKTKEGVVELPSGVQYKIMKEGTGAFPKETDTVTVHYKGTLLDGTVFDSSIERGEPVTFPLNQVIKGWTEGMQKCKLGGKIQLFIPSELAYGDKTTGPIPGGSALVFEVELLKLATPAPVVAAPEKPAAKAPVKKAPAKTTAAPAAKTVATTPAAKTAVKPAATTPAKPAVKK